jgi:ipoprotein LpqH
VKSRFMTMAVTVLVVASCAGCLHSGKPTEKTARITVDNNTRTSHAVTCYQVQWLLTANITAPPTSGTAPPAKVQVLLKLGPDNPQLSPENPKPDSENPKRDSEYPKLESVNFDNFAGFTGVSDSGAGDAKAVFANGRYTITGTAEGSQLNDPRVSLTAPFKIEVGC